MAGGTTMTELCGRGSGGRYDRAYQQTPPDTLEAFGEFNNAVFSEEGREIPLKYRELIAYAVGLTTQCAHCIDAHSNDAVKAGATETELAETAWTASALRAGGAFAHGRLGFKLTGVDEHRGRLVAGCSPPNVSTPTQMSGDCLAREAIMSDESRTPQRRAPRSRPHRILVLALDGVSAVDLGVPVQVFGAESNSAVPPAPAVTSAAAVAPVPGDPSTAPAAAAVSPAPAAP